MGKSKNVKLPKIILYDKPVIFCSDVAERVETRLRLWRKVCEANPFSRYRLSLLLIGEVKVEKDEAMIAVKDFFAMPAWFSSTIELDVSISDIETIAQEYMVVATLVACPEHHPLNPFDVGFLLSVDAVVGKPIPHIIYGADGQKRIISFEKCTGIAELLKSLKANLERRENV